MGGVAIWFYGKGVFTKDMAPVSQLSAAERKCSDALLELGLLKEQQRALQMTLEKAEGASSTSRVEAQAKSLDAARALTNLASMESAHDSLHKAHHALVAESRRDKDELAQLAGRLQAAEDRYAHTLRDREELGEAIKAQFSVLAGQVLDTKTQTFNQQQETKLNDLLNPFKQQIESFRQQVTEKFTDEGKDKAALKREIELLNQTNTLLGKQATSLTEALRGSTKKQGDWGEGILESILEYCGLTKGIHYVTQATSRTEEGITIRPDVLVHLPGKRSLVIDSKVSLVHYWDLCAAANADVQAACLPLINRSLRQHIDCLYKKPYNEVAGTPDYLIMFVPVEAAYIMALQHDATIWQYAYSRNVVLISPTNLIPFMRVVQHLWDTDDKHNNAKEIADRAGKLYDKLAGFVSNYLKIGTELETAQKAYQEGLGQLSSGKDNLIRQAEKMKALNISNKKELPASLVESALLGADLPALND